MVDLVQSVKVNARIVFNNNISYTIQFASTSNTDLKTYGISCSLSEALYKASSSDIIGNAGSGLLTIKLKSLDGLLIPSNALSAYYGLMDSTAIIYLSAVYNSNVTVNFGKFYVTNWESGTSNTDAKTVTIVATNLYGHVKNIDIGKVRLKEHLTFSSYLISIINTLNSKLTSREQISYVTSELEKLDNIYSTNWQMWYNNIERNDLETIFNTIAKNTLTYIWIDRTNTLKVDCLLDDNTEQSVSDLSGTNNMLKYSLNNQSIYNYKGVQTEYISNVSYEDKEVLALKDYSLQSGLNVIKANLNTKKCINVFDIMITNNGASVTTFYSFRDSIEISVIASSAITVDIYVYGTVINETYSTYVDRGYTSGDILDIKNDIMAGASNIEAYTDKYGELIRLSNGQLNTDGWFNPSLVLGNIVTANAPSLYISDTKYKITCIDITFGTSYRSKLSLIRTVEAEVEKETEEEN